MILPTCLICIFTLISCKIEVPVPILTDSYKVSHPFEYPAAQKMVAYGEFRRGFDKDVNDTRLIVTGIRYIVENYIQKQWTIDDIERSASFFSTHGSGFSQFRFPKDLFLKIVNERNGYFPVKIEALIDGTVAYPHVPVYVITAEKEYSRLVTYLETLLTMIWYPSTVATLSRRVKDVIQNAFSKSVDLESQFLINSRLHDFGFRGCTSVEQAMIGGTAHLLNFQGSDTMNAAYHAQYNLNGGKPVGNSIPATEHSVMTSYRTEREAIMQMVEEFGEGVFAVVMDSYDYVNALENVLPSIKKEKLEKGGYMVLRPDSGNPVEVVLQALQAAEKVFGFDYNSKNFKVIRGCGVIQGDGINYKNIQEILDAVLQAGYSAQNVAFGMGAGLLQKVNRDTMSFATKLSHITYEDGTKRDVMKAPKTDLSKFSLPGEFVVILNEENVPMVYPKQSQSQKNNLLKVVYDNGPVDFKWDDFDSIRAKLESQWRTSPKTADAVSDELKEKIRKVLDQIHNAK